MSGAARSAAARVTVPATPRPNGAEDRGARPAAQAGPRGGGRGRLPPREGGAIAAGQEPEALIRPLEDLLGGQVTQPGGPRAGPQAPRSRASGADNAPDGASRQAPTGGPTARRCSGREPLGVPAGPAVADLVTAGDGGPGGPAELPLPSPACAERHQPPPVRVGGDGHLPAPAPGQHRPRVPRRVRMGGAHRQSAGLRRARGGQEHGVEPARHRVQAASQPGHARGPRWRPEQRRAGAGPAPRRPGLRWRRRCGR